MRMLLTSGVRQDGEKHICFMREKVPETGYMKNPGTRRIEVWFPDSDY